MAIDLNKPIVSATLADLKELLQEMQLEQSLVPAELNKPSEKRYVYGLAGIAQLFSCSMSTAYRIKQSGILDPAISQVNRLLVVDADYALDLVKVNTKWRKKSRGTKTINQ